MSISSIQLYVKGLLNGIALPTVPAENLIAIVTPPSVDDRTDARVYIWGSTGTEARRTMPRGVGANGAFKEMVHTLDIWVVWFDEAIDALADSQFPSVMETIMNVLRSTTMPVLNLLDTTTGRVTNVTMIGEDMRWDYAPVHTLVPQREIYRYDGRIVVTVKEWLQS